MKPLLVAFLCLMLFACTRNVDRIGNADASLEGTWRMVSVRDNGTGFMHTKPGAVTGNVDITFVPVTTGNGFINGATPSQPIEANYELGLAGVIKVPAITYGKIAETSWGLDFLQNFVSADTYSFGPDGKLHLHTQNKTLYFRRN